MRDRPILAATIVLALLSVPAKSEAAPQILGVAAADEPNRLQCADGTCVADISTFCMQPHRPVPGPNAVYRAAGEGFRLILEDAAGNMHSRPAPEVRIVKLRGYTSVTVAIAEHGAAFFGLKPVAIAIKKRSVLIPADITGDPDPIRPGEVEHALAALRPIADGIFAKHIETLQATTLINRLVNATPAQGRMTASDRGELWGQAIGDDQSVARPAAERAKNILSFCQSGVGAGAFFSVRRCLENRLDGMMMDLNTKYWKGIEPGS